MIVHVIGIFPDWSLAFLYHIARLFYLVSHMKSIDKTFYNSKAWKVCRAAYLASHSLCERCLKKGEIAPAEIVHHVIHLNKSNVHDPSITLNPDNLEALCMTCHNQEHFAEQTPRRWSFDEYGEFEMRGDPP